MSGLRTNSKVRRVVYVTVSLRRFRVHGSGFRVKDQEFGGLGLKFDSDDKKAY